MKKLLGISSFSVLTILVALQISFTSYKKENAANPKTKAELLTSKTWKYMEYYRNTGTLVYKRGNASNLINLDQNRVTFYA